MLVRGSEHFFEHPDIPYRHGFLVPVMGNPHTNIAALRFGKANRQIFAPASRGTLPDVDFIRETLDKAQVLRVRKGIDRDPLAERAPVLIIVRGLYRDLSDKILFLRR